MKQTSYLMAAAMLVTACATETPAARLQAELDAECQRIDEIIPIMMLRNMAAGPMVCDDGFGQPIECDFEETPEEIAERERQMALYERQLADYKAAQAVCEDYREHKEKAARQEAAFNALKGL